LEEILNSLTSTKDTSIQSIENLEIEPYEFQNPTFYKMKNFIQNFPTILKNFDLKNPKKTFNKKTFKNLTKNKEALLDLKFYKEQLKEINENTKKFKNPSYKLEIKFLMEMAFYTYNIKIAYQKLLEPEKTLKYFEKTLKAASQILILYISENNTQFNSAEIVFGLKNLIDDLKRRFICRNKAHLHSTKTLLNIIEIIHFTTCGEGSLSINDFEGAFKHFKRVLYLAKKIYKDFPNHPHMIYFSENLENAENEINDTEESEISFVEILEACNL
jgi:hypothetical protein